MAVPPKILELIATFERNADEYRGLRFNEANLCQQFVIPMFKQLGWDMDNEQGHSERYKDVVHQASLRIGGETKAPDYCFRIGGAEKFYLEAKKPAVNVVNDPAPAYQLRRYGWSARLPVSILTNFETFAVYDCRVRPRETDKASAARIKLLDVKEYPARWDEIEGVFSLRAIARGDFDRFCDTEKLKKGTATVDAAFLQEIEQWREVLAKNLALRNPRLSTRELNLGVQVTIDRIIFLRMCEDRGIEPERQLWRLTEGSGVYARLRELFRKADDRYNSGLFYFEKEKGRAEPPDDLTPRLKIDDKVLADIFRGLYFPASPYVFQKIPPEILGQVYEQFLGKVIRLTAGHQAKVEEKPEVKKAGGVYYTPKYIVDYIVKYTVGRLLAGLREGEAPAEPLAPGSAGASPSRPANPSPGPSPTGGGEKEGKSSADRSANPSPGPSPCGGGEKGFLPLSVSGRGLGGGVSAAMTPKQAAKLRILDPACGSGSFLLGAYQYLLDWHLEWYIADGPTQHKKELFRTAGGDWRLTIKERKQILLNNIYGVDIDPQAVEVTKLSLLLQVLDGESAETLEHLHRLWHERALPDLASNIKCGNSLIGPDFYEGQQLKLFDEEEQERINVFDWDAAFPAIMKAGGFDAVIGNPPWGGYLSPEERVHLSRRFTNVADYETAQFFLAKSGRIVDSRGVLAMIVPNTLALNVYARNFRNSLVAALPPYVLADFSDVDVFENPNVRSMIYAGRRGANGMTSCIAVAPARPQVVDGNHRLVDPKEIAASDSWQVFFSRNGELPALIRKLTDSTVLLSTLCEVRQGYIPYRTTTLTRRHGLMEAKRIVTSRSWHAAKKQSQHHERELQGGDVDRYVLAWSGQWVKYGPWVSTHLPISVFSGPRILIREITGKPPHVIRATYSDDTFVHNPSVLVAAPHGQLPSPFWILGILNSRLMSAIFLEVAPKARKGLFPKIIITDARRLRFPAFNVSQAADRKHHDRMVELVDRMLVLHQQMAKAKSPSVQAALKTQIAATDRQIDRLVYDLYGLTEDEIRIVEGATVTSS